jgi:hypothetical protein
MPMRISNRVVTTPTIAPRRDLAHRETAPDYYVPPHIVNGEVVRSRTRLPIYRSYVDPVIFNRYEHKPDTMLQALLPAFVCALPIAAMVLAMWVWLPVQAAVMTFVGLAMYAVKVHRPEHTMWQVFRRLLSLVFLAVLMYPARTVAHCCCRLLRL